MKDKVFQDSSKSNPNKNTHHQTETETETNQSSQLSTEEILNNILSSAKQGKIPDQKNIEVGKTSLKDLTEQFGESTQKDQVANGTYLTYQKQGFAVGYDHQNRIYEVRSYDANLQKIHYDDIMKQLKKPSKVKYYKDQQVDQIILVYELPNHMELKFILPRPTSENNNPTLHHTSVSMIEQLNPSTGSNLEQLLSTMTLQEKIGQMIFSGFYGTNYSNSLKELVEQYHIGGFIFYNENLTNNSQTVKLVNSIKAANRNNHLPILFGVDQEGGRVSRLPGNLGQIPSNGIIGKKNNGRFSFEIGQILGEQLQAFGLNMDFAPVLDVNSNPKNPVIGDRSFSNNPKTVSNLGIQTMKGIQSEKIIPVIKHFPGHGDTSVDSHLELPVVNKSYTDLKSLELIPFKDAINQNADAVMVAHILLPKIDPKYPASMSKIIITSMLRDDLKYDGVVMTDDMTMDAIGKNYNLEKAAVTSILAGSDIIMVAHDPNKVKAVYKEIETAVKNKTISEERINESVKRIILLKQKYKLDNHQVKPMDLQKLVEKTNQLLNK
ncbi:MULTISPECIES: beta-N-acetylhexosaminidase [unclassified Bacillus (in: firmicutes)]|uniref:beta-N-acetylhexosaminidase n=1 Tax=unclassified Bacillus (in: firmicutes) TaxID=185979 RepID=UPI001144E9EE|nr:MULTISPECIES: beta-N-acetylhexosaminidase [unclassified Bacillus (in: firmicutes)]